MQENLSICIYNKNHKVRKCKLYFHELNCPDQKYSDLVSCQYDFSHKVKKSNLDKHHLSCPLRPKIDQDINREMLEYSRKHSSIYQKQNCKNIDMKKENKQNFPVGLNYMIKKKENKETERQIVKINEKIENGDNENFEIINYNYKIFDNELHIELNDSEINHNSFSFRFDEIEKSKKFEHENYNEFSILEKEIKMNIDKLEISNENYDPNESDEYIDKYNRNNQSFES
jgi:hypothetical protein